MSWHGADDPIPGDAFSCDAIQTLIVPRSRDLGSFAVRRALPSTQCRMVGPFVFFDRWGRPSSCSDRAWTCVRTRISASRR